MVQKEYKRFFNLRETMCSITSDRESAIEAATYSIKHHRDQLEKYIKTNPIFLHSLHPLCVNEGPLIVKLMAKAAKKADVGPMAAVAGILADLAVKEMVRKGAEVAVVENGGEAYAVSNRPLDVVLVAGDSSLSKKIGFRLTDFPIGVATSSGVFSHALSFGDAETVTVFAITAGLADAVATAVGNLVKGEDYRSAINLGINKALSINGVKGVFILYKDLVGKAGQIPQLIKVT